MSGAEVNKSITSSSSSFSSNNPNHLRVAKKWVFTAVILFLGGAASAAFLSLGIVGIKSEQEDRFANSAEELFHAVQMAWHDYELLGLWIHESCFESAERRVDIPIQEDVEGHLGICSRDRFRSLYEHITSHDASFQAVQFLPLIYDSERSELERQSREFYAQNYPDLKYQGVTQSNRPGGNVSRSQQPFYWPVHYVEPVDNNEAAIDLDSYSTAQSASINKVVSTFKPVLSGALKLVQEADPNAFGIILQHPGVPTSKYSILEPTALSQVVIRVPDLLVRATSGLVDEKSVYLFDSTESTKDPDFLGAVRVRRMDGKKVLVNLPPLQLSEVPRSNSSRSITREINVADRYWTVTVTSDDSNSDLVFIILGGLVIFCACILIAVWFRTHMSRIDKLNQLRTEAEEEKSKNANIQVARERKMNEFLSHEVSHEISQ